MYPFNYSIWFQEKKKKSVNKIAYFQCRRNKRRLARIIKIINAYNVTTKSSNSERLLQVNFDIKTNFQFHITSLCFNLSRKLYAPARKKALYGSSKK